MSPVINESCKQVSREDLPTMKVSLQWATRLVHEADLLPVMASHKKATTRERAGRGRRDRRARRRRGPCRNEEQKRWDELMAEATSLEQSVFGHYPKNPFCRNLHERP